MPFKIYAYSDPYQLYKTHFWDEVRSVPHLCVSQTLVNGLRWLFNDKFESALIPIDNVLSQLYPRWHRNVENQIAQYTVLSKVLADWKENRIMDENLYSAFKHNQSELLSALRLMVELDIDHSRLFKQKNFYLQSFLIDLYKMICAGNISEVFKFPEVTATEEINKSIRRAVEEENNDFIERNSNKNTEELSKNTEELSDYDKTIEWYKKVLENLHNNQLTKLVIHGLHQFTPLQLRFIFALHEAGVEIVFLFNYQKQFKEIYDTWEYIYRFFEVPIEFDNEETNYWINCDSKSHALAKCMASLLKSETEDNKIDKASVESLKKVEFIEFDNVTEFAGYVAGHFDKAGNNLKKMTEQVYSAGSEVQDLLKVYYPEQSGDRHFLAYPIGQFFSALYKMWDPESSQLKIEMKLLRECLASGIIEFVPAERLIAILQNTSLYFQGINNFEEFKNRIQKYIHNYEKIQNEPGDLMKWLRRLSVYNNEYVEREDLDILLNAVEGLNDTAKSLFETKDGQDGFIIFKNHFERLEEFIRKRLPDSLILKEERELVEDLLARFGTVGHGALGNGTIEDLRTGLYFYLRQKDKEKVDWIVRNFEQIDGDILRSRRSRNGKAEERCYHFASLSDRDMNKKVDDLLPWPLTDSFIMKSYTPIEQHFQVYYAALGEYTNFLRYALFYGLCFNEEAVRISYVRNYKEEIVQPYFLFRMMGIEPKRYVTPVEQTVSAASTVLSPSVQSTRFRITRDQAQAFVLCPYGYFLNYTFKGEIIPNSLFLYQHFYVNLLIDQVWQKIQNQPLAIANERVSDHIEDAHNNISQFFPFWRSANDFADFKKQAFNFIGNQLKKNLEFIKYDKDYMSIRLLFKKAKFEYEDTEEVSVHPYEKIDNLYYQSTMNQGKPFKVVSLAKQPLKKPPVPSDIKETVENYMVNEKLPKEHPGVWCTFCSQKGRVCLKPYIM